MKFISSREFRIRPGEVWGLLEQGEDLVVTMHGKPFGVLIGTSETNLPEMMIEIARLRARIAVTGMQRAARRAGLDKMSMAQIDGVISEVRAKGKRRGSGKK